MSLEPASNCSEFMRNNSLICNFSDGRFTVLYEEKFMDSILSGYEVMDSLILKLFSGDPYFFHYTDINHNQGEIIFLSSKNVNGKNALKVDDSSAFITGEDEVNINDCFHYSALSKRERIASPLGLIEIRIMDLIENGQINNKSYHINFNSRQTYWRYNLICQQYHFRYERLKIIDTNQEILFIEQEEKKLANGDNALQIVSDCTIPLKEYSEQRFDLVGVREGFDSVIIKYLDTPRFFNLTKENDRYISELYIYC